MKVTRGNILNADGLVCIPVNVVGVHGAGLAKQWADANPEHAALYRQSCANYRIRGETTLINNFWMLPTKMHWKDVSDWELIEPRLKKDLDNIIQDDWGFINIPKIGCGLGQLSWNRVYPILTDILLDIEQAHKDVKFRLFV